MKGFIRLTNVYQNAPVLVNVNNICYFYRQDVGTKHTVISTTSSQHCLAVQEDFDQVVEMIEKAQAEKQS
ncbi:MAG: hypothetical protein JWO03_2929 [Bacteroidetes bacterium]|nr:hypothetical protein [Bacteroidota bacterium]